jgi:uncharacterized protein (TIGR00269 family)
MKCRKCGDKAVINMRHHKLSLCEEHYLEWLPKYVEFTIKKYGMFTPQERILVAVSGGKDSLSLWDILHRLGYRVDGVYIGLGIDENGGYSNKSERMTRSFANQHGLRLHVIDLEDKYGESVPDLARRTWRGKDKPCAVCGIVKRHILNQVAREGAYEVLVTGHNLDDEAATLFSNALNWIPGYLTRQAPVLDANLRGTVRKAKPLCRIYEREMAAYAYLRGIEYIYEECPFSKGSNTIYYKELLNQLEKDRPGAKLSYYVAFLQARENGLFAPQADPDLEKIHPCTSCGQPTSAPDKCSFCRMFPAKEIQ